MKQNLIWSWVLSFAVFFFVPLALLAQKEERDKEVTDKKDVQQIIITRKGDKDGKVVIEVNGDKVTVNGKPLDDYKEGDIKVRVNKLRDLESLSRIPGMGTWNFNGNENFNFFGEDDNRAMLGVSTGKVENGAEVQDITKESAAEKAGLKKNDIITKIDDTKIDGPDDLSAVIRKHKPGDKVTVTYQRDKKEQKVKAELTKWKGMRMYGTTTPGGNFKMEIPDMKLYEEMLPGIQKTMPRIMAPNGQNWNWPGGSPKLGLSVQDTDDGKGVKVIEVDDESNAEKAGIKEDDIITEVDGKAVNGADEMAKIIRESKDKISVMIKLQRGGKTQNMEVKMPRKLKTADL